MLTKTIAKRDKENEAPSDEEEESEELATHLAKILSLAQRKELPARKSKGNF